MGSSCICSSFPIKHRGSIGLPNIYIRSSSLIERRSKSFEVVVGCDMGYRKCWTMRGVRIWISVVTRSQRAVKDNALVRSPSEQIHTTPIRYSPLLSL